MDRPLDEDQDDTLELTEDMEIEDTDTDQNAGDDETDDATTGEGDDEEETVISFDGDDADDADKPGDSSVIRRLRQELRESKRRAAELERTNTKPKVEVGPKPTLAECGFDEEAYDAALEAWRDKKAAAEAEDAKAEEEVRRANESWERDLSAYNVRKASIGIPDFSEAEEAVKTALNPMQQAVIVKAASDPAALVAALGKSEAKLAELAKFEDPIKMAAAVARMEGAVKVIKRKKAPAVDRPASGSASMPGGADKKLEKLEKEADRTGDRTNLIRYRRSLDAKKTKK